MAYSKTPAPNSRSAVKDISPEMARENDFPAMRRGNVYKGRNPARCRPADFGQMKDGA